MVFDLVSTLLDTYGEQEGEAFNCHYQAHGCHPLLCFDGITGDLLKAQLRDGTHSFSRDADQFMVPLLQEYRTKHLSLPLCLRGDSGFASPGLYKSCEDNDCKYAIRLKTNKMLLALAEEKADDLRRATKDNMVDYAATYGEFECQADSWPYPRRVAFKIEKPANQMVFMYTFVVTAMESEPYQVIRFYCGRGKMENFRIGTVRLKLLKIAARVIHSARYTTFKLCSSSPYKSEFFETLQNIRQLQLQLK